MKLKLFKPIIAALLALTLMAGCDNAGRGGDSNPTHSSLTITMGGMASRAEAPGAAGASVAFSSGHLYFVTAQGSIVKYMTISCNGTSLTKDNVDVADLKSAGGATIPNVPTNVARIHIIGNVPPAITVPTSGDISGLTGAVLDIATQVDLTGGTMGDVTLYGEGAVTSQTAGTSKVYAASLDVMPLVWRLEIGAIAYDNTKGVAPQLTSYAVEGIFINKYYPAATPAGTMAALVDNGTENREYMYFGGNGSAAYPTAYNGITHDWKTGGIGTLSGLDYTPGAGKVWAYNLFPGNVPQVVIRLNQLEPSAFTGIEFLAIDRFRDENGELITAFEAGKVYKISRIVFNKDHLGQNPTTSVEAECTVDILPWTEIDIPSPL